MGLGVLAPDVVAGVQGVDQVESHLGQMHLLRPLLSLLSLLIILSPCLLKAVLEGEAIVHGNVVKQSPKIASRHALDHRTDHQKQSIVLDPSSLRVMQLELPAHPLIHKKQGLYHRKGPQRVGNIARVLFIEVIPMKHRNIEDLPLIVPSKGNLDAADFPFEEVDVLDVPLLPPLLQGLVDLLKSGLEVNVLVCFGDQTDVDV